MNPQQISQMWEYWLQQQKKGIYLVSVSFKEGGLRGKIGALCWWVTVPLIVWWFIPTGHSFWVKVLLYYVFSGFSWWGTHLTFYKYSINYHTGMNMILSWWTGVTKSKKS